MFVVWLSCLDFFLDLQWSRYSKYKILCHHVSHLGPNSCFVLWSAGENLTTSYHISFFHYIGEKMDNGKISHHCTFYGTMRSYEAGCKRQAQNVTLRGLGGSALNRKSEGLLWKREELKDSAAFDCLQNRRFMMQWGWKIHWFISS